MKLGPCATPSSSTLNISACNNYLLNGEIFDSTGTYVQTIANSTGCESVITLHLTINKKTTEKLISICDGENYYAGGGQQTTSGVYYDTLQTTLGCDSVLITRLTVNPKPIPSLGEDRNLCNGTQAIISPGTFDQYLWQDMSVSNSYVVGFPGLYWVKVTNGFNCSSTDSINILSLLPLPDQFLKKTDSICNYQTLDLAPNKNFSQYLWSTGATIKQITVNLPGIYRLSVTDANGCTGRDSIVIYPKNCMLGVYIPTAFTPNRDGHNDVFKATVFGKLLSFKLQVFSREGKLIFQTTDPAKGWDGTFGGLSHSTAAFVWQCSYQLENQEPTYKKGSVVIVK
ncbi:MAG: gliding motility-associated C-terminal domain-containing protein [Chitinophagaceae bacterium]|nr:gliding motility-associated C-terminal domain-containing protein [Chitinophagaceae bacterium]